MAHKLLFHCLPLQALFFYLACNVLSLPLWDYLESIQRPMLELI